MLSPNFNNSILLITFRAYFVEFSVIFATDDLNCMSFTSYTSKTSLMFKVFYRSMMFLLKQDQQRFGGQF